MPVSVQEGSTLMVPTLAPSGGVHSGYGEAIPGRWKKSGKTRSRSARTAAAFAPGRASKGGSGRSPKVA